MSKLTEMAMELLMIDAEESRHRNIPEQQERGDVTMIRLNGPRYSVYVFEQTWASTALGFNGMGGSAMTTANTCVLVPFDQRESCQVYFAGRFAYAVPCSDVFMHDVNDRNMEPVRRRGKYLEAVQNRNETAQI